MDDSLIRAHKLAGPEGNGLSPYLNEKGAFLGPGMPLLKMHRDATGLHRWRPRAREELERVLSAGYGMPVDLGSRMDALAAVAKALSDGDTARAAVALLHARLPPLPDSTAVRRLAEADRLVKYTPLQPRIPKGHTGGGRWAREDGGAEALFQQIAYNLPPAEAKLAQRLFALLREAPENIAALWKVLKEEGLSLDELPAALKSVFDPPQPLAALQTTKPPRGFESWAALRNYLGPPPPGYEWHHIVPQAQIRPDLTSLEGQREWVQNTENVVLVPVLKHMLITAEMNRIIYPGGPRFRDIVRMHSSTAQQEIGIDLLRKYGVLQ